jgi:hypothetical protein
MYTQVDFLADTIIIEALAKNADANSVITGVAISVKNYVLEHFDKKRPVASVVAFLGPGILWSLGFKWISVLYEVVEALGFDWVGFWEKVKNGIETFLSTIVSGEKPSEETISSHVSEVIITAMGSSFTSQTDESKLQGLADSKTSFSMHDALELKKFALRNDRRLLKSASFISLFKGKISRFFINTIGWVITVGLVSLGFAAAGGAISGLLGLHSNPSESGASPESRDYSSTEPQPVQQLELSPSASPDLSQYHENDIEHTWIESGDIHNLKQILLDWITSAYPQVPEGIENSNAFAKMVVMFNNRNKMAEGTDMITVPPPYTRKIDIVSQVVNGFLKESPQPVASPKQTGQNVVYQ